MNLEETDRWRKNPRWLLWCWHLWQAIAGYSWRLQCGNATRGSAACSNSTKAWDGQKGITHRICLSNKSLFCHEWVVARVSGGHSTKKRRFLQRAVCSPRYLQEGTTPDGKERKYSETTEVCWINSFHYWLFLSVNIMRAMNLPGDPMKIWQGCEESYIEGTLSWYINCAENCHKCTKWFPH